METSRADGEQYSKAWSPIQGTVCNLLLPLLYLLVKTLLSKQPPSDLTAGSVD